MQETEPYTIDLTKVEGDGNVKCPKCKAEISPDDFSEEVYTILEPVVTEDRLKTIIIRCNRCTSIIHLAGFDAFSNPRA